jgi:hypothetical protein
MFRIGIVIYDLSYSSKSDKDLMALVIDDQYARDSHFKYWHEVVRRRSVASDFYEVLAPDHASKGKK